MKVVLSAVALLAASLTVLWAFPTIYPTGTTIYDPDKAWSGYTIHDTPNGQGAVLIDMNGNIVRRWKAINGVPGPGRILPGGFVMGGVDRRPTHQEMVALVQLDWDGNVAWKFDRNEKVQEKDQEPRWMARLHHDWQREGSPVGYYAPGLKPLTDRGKTLILTHTNLKKPEMTDRLLEDDRIIEVDWEGEVVWEWLATDHFDELGFTETAKNALHRSPNWSESRQAADWLHINSLSYVGPNKWYDAGDERFHPENVLWTSRTSNITAIVDKKTGKIAWRLGPDYQASEALRKLGQIVGQHKGHIIPRGLPGEGHLLVFDNGGAAGYGAPNPGAPTGANNAVRFYSRVLEIDPTTLEVVWEYTIPSRQNRYKFFSSYVSSAQRLPNGNTMVNEGAGGRLFELTEDKEIVWEYINPIFGLTDKYVNRIFRAYRVPYDWVPQLEQPEEKPVIPPDITQFRVPAQGAETVAEALAGSWKLVSLDRHWSDGEVNQPWGSAPQGLLFYDNEGNMSAQLMSTDWADTSPKEQGLEALPRSGYAAYFGTYEVDERDGTVTHQVIGDRQGFWIGKSRVRRFQLERDRISLETPPRTVEGRTSELLLVWERVASP